MQRELTGSRVRLAYAAVCLTCVGALWSGCRPRPTEPASGSPAAAPVTLRFWHIMNYTGPREVLASAVQRFEADNPNITVQVETFENDAYKTKLAVEMAGGTPPDVFFTWGGGGLAALAKGGKALNLTHELAVDGWRERILAAALPLCMVRGKVYAVPLDLSCVPVWYNRDIFREHGIQPPATFTELLGVCDRLDSAGVTPFALGNKNQWPGALFFVCLAAREGGTQLFLDAVAGQAGATFADSAFVRAGEDLQLLVAHNAFGTGFNGVDVGVARTQFLSGKAAMYLMGTWLVARAAEERPDFMEKLDCFPFPAASRGDGNPRTMTGGVNCAFAVSTASRHRPEAIELIRYLTGPDVAAEWCTIGRIPALHVSQESLAQLPEPSKKALALLRDSGPLQPYYDQYLDPRLAEVHKSTTQELFAGTMTAEGAARKMASAAAEH